MKSVTIRFPEELVEKVKALAVSERRSFNSQLVVLVESALSEPPQSKSKTESLPNDDQQRQPLSRRRERPGAS